MRIHGENPSDWHDDLAFEYELRLQAEPTDAGCAALARAWTASCGGKAPCCAGAVLFSKEYVFLTAFPRRQGRDERQLFAHVARFLRQVDREIAPMVEATLLSAAVDLRELDPGPGHPASQRPVDPSYPAPAAREAYDAVVRALALEAKRERFAKWTAEPPAGLLGLRIVGRPQTPPEPEVAEPLRALFCDGEGPYPMRWAGAASRPQRVPVDSAVPRDVFEMKIAGESRTLALPEGLTTWGIAVVHPDASRVALEAKDGRRGVVVMIDTTTGDMREVWATSAGEQGLGVLGLAWLTDDHLAVATTQRLVVLHVPAVGEASARHVVKGDRTIWACREGRLIYDVNTGFLAWDGAKLSKATKWKVDRLYLHCETVDRIVLRQGRPLEESPDDTYFELTRLDEVLAERATPRPAKTKKPVRAQKTKTAWIEVEVAPPAPTADAEHHPARGGWTHPGNPLDAQLRWGPEKNPALVKALEADVWATLCKEGMTLAKGDDVQRVTQYAPKRLALSPKGTRGYALDPSYAIVWAFSGERAEPERVVWDGDAKTGEISDIAPVGEDEVLIVGKQAAVWLRREDGVWKALARSGAIKGGRRAVAVGERVAVIAEGAKPLLVVERAGEALKKVASDADGADDLFVLDGALHAVRPTGSVVRFG